MVNKVQRRQVWIFTLFLATFAILSLPGSSVFAVEPEWKENQQTFGGQEKEFPNGMIRKVVREGMPHKNPVDLEEPLQGICPQERNTPQAPEPFYKMTNPLEPTSENLRAGETLFKIDAGPTACKVCHGYGGGGLGVIF